MIFSTIQVSALSLIHYWNFNGTNVPYLTEGTSKDVVLNPLTPISTDLSVTSSPATLIYQAIPGTTTAMSYWDITTGSTGNARNGEVAGNCLRPRDAWASMQLVLNIPSTGFSNVKIMYDSQRSGSGPSINTYSYSIDGGLNWIATGLSTTTNPVAIPSTGFVIQTVTITDINANNNPNLQFKILFSDPTNKAGNNRIDNITVEGDILARVNSTFTDNVTMYPNPCNSGIVTFDKTVSVEVYNMVGRLMKSSSNTSSLITNDLAKGVYIIRLDGQASQKLVVE